MPVSGASVPSWSLGVVARSFMLGGEAEDAIVLGATEAPLDAGPDVDSFDGLEQPTTEPRTRAMRTERATSAVTPFPEVHRGSPRARAAPCNSGRRARA